MPLTEEFIELLRRPTEEITSTINQEFLQANDAIEILRFVGDPEESIPKLYSKPEFDVIDEDEDCSFEDFRNEDAETFEEMHEKASDVFKHVFTFLNPNQKQEVISDNEYELFYSAAVSGSFPQVSFLIEEAKKLEQETGQEILQPMISARNYQGFRGCINEEIKSASEINQLILDSVSEENHLPMITSTDEDDNETTLLIAVKNDYVDLVEHIFENVPNDKLREVISSTIDDESFYENSKIEMVLQKASDLGIDLQEKLLEKNHLLLGPGHQYLDFIEAFKKYASEETLEATLTSFLASPESKNNFFTKAIRISKVIEPVVNSLILSPQIELNLNDLSESLGLVKINHGNDKQLAKSSRYLLAVLHLENDSSQHQKAKKHANDLLSNSYLTTKTKLAAVALYKGNPTLLLEDDLNQTTIDRLGELRIELIKKFSQENSDPSSKSDLVAEKKANLTIKGLLENDGLKKFKNLANDVFIGLSEKFPVGVISKFFSYASGITLKGLDRSERKVALEVIAGFFEKKSRDVILRMRERNQDNSSKNSNEDSGVKAAEPEIKTESVAGEEVNFTSKVPANEESKPNPQIENPEISNLKMSQQNQDNSSENPNKSNNKKQRIR